MKNKNMRISTTLCMALMAVELVIAIPSAKAETVVTADQTFLLAASQGSMMNVKLSELTVQKGMRPDVQKFGQVMMKEHADTAVALKALAAQSGLALPVSLDAEHQKIVDNMAAAIGADFDAAYIAYMIKGHKMDDAAFKAESATTQDANIKSFSDNSIPVTEAHLKHISAMKW